MAHKESYYRETVATTWDVSFKAIEQTDPLANVILRISAFLDGKQIQKDLFYDTNLKVCGRERNISDWEVNTSFGILMSYSLVHPIKSSQCVEMHLLVQNVIRDITRFEQVELFMASAELVDTSVGRGYRQLEGLPLLFITSTNFCGVRSRVTNHK